MKELSLKILLLCSSIIFTLLLLEILLRILPINNNLYSQNIIWNHWNQPAGMPKMYNENYAYDDLLGYEKKEVYEEIKRVIIDNKSDYKILILGDSVTEQALYVYPFEDLITSRYNNSSIKIINAGVTGYDTGLEYNYLKYRGLDLEPDLVIIQFHMNDFGNTPVIIKQKDGFWLALTGDKKLSKWINPVLFANSKIYESITVMLLTLSKKKEKKEYKNNVLIPLTNIKNLLEEEEIPFYLLIFPLFEDSEFGRRAYGKIVDIVNELDLNSKSLDLIPYYSNVSFENVRIDSSHPNEEEGKIAAIALMGKLTPFLDEQLLKNE